MFVVDTSLVTLCCLVARRVHDEMRQEEKARRTTVIIGEFILELLDNYFI
jgi:hypothetical protein